jgi:hypothetical protein
VINELISLIGFHPVSFLKPRPEGRGPCSIITPSAEGFRLRLSVKTNERML